MPAAIDPVSLTAELVRCASVTPDEGGALGVLERALAPFGFVCTRVDRGNVANLFAKWGGNGPALGFNGHTDVVPAGDAAAWTHPPFSGAFADECVWGRGSVDMKSGVAAFAAAAAARVAEAPPPGSLSLLITGDEEGAALDGTRALLDWMRETGERLDACIVGEPTSVAALGDMVKIGRRGSMTAQFIAHGVQGHTAYPHRARNPLPALVRLLDRLARAPLDQGTARFDPSTLQITTIDVGNPAGNVIPATGRATVNIRFNDAHDSAALTAMLRAEADAAQEDGVTIGMTVSVSGESFLTPPGAFTDLVAGAVARRTGRTPDLSTTGGTSDARFVKDICPVVEVGLVGRGMHAVDERAPVAEIVALADVYRGIIDAFFARQ
jgi:succinyl-diaminopimelate desuccinylase